MFGAACTALLQYEHVHIFIVDILVLLSGREQKLSTHLLQKLSQRQVFCKVFFNFMGVFDFFFFLSQCCLDVKMNFT